MGQFIPACRVTLRLKFYLELFAHLSVITGKGESRWISGTVQLSLRSQEYDFTIETLLKDTIFPLNRMSWYPYVAEQSTIFSIPRTGSEFHVQLSLYYEGYSKYSVILTGSSENILALTLTDEVRQVQHFSLWGTIQHVSYPLFPKCSSPCTESLSACYSTVFLCTGPNAPQ